MFGYKIALINFERKQCERFKYKTLCFELKYKFVYNLYMLLECYKQV